MLNPLDQFFEQKAEPVKSCLQYLPNFFLSQEGITEHWKYGMPMYYLNGKMFSYLWIHKRYLQPYIGWVDGNQMHHEDLMQEKRAKMKILLIDPAQDIPKHKIMSILAQAFALRA